MLVSQLRRTVDRYVFACVSVWPPGQVMTDNNNIHCLLLHHTVRCFGWVIVPGDSEQSASASDARHLVRSLLLLLSVYCVVCFVVHVKGGIVLAPTNKKSEKIHTLALYSKKMETCVLTVNLSGSIELIWTHYFISFITGT